MPSAAPPNPRAEFDEPDDLDNIFSNDYNTAVNDFLQDIPINNTSSAKNVLLNPAPVKDIDEEITVKRKRAPNPKLDFDRLCSQNGIPKLRRITKSRLKFRGKGYEYSDISRLLSTYQLWLDDLFPKAKFRDALQIVEKVGHTKRMQVERRVWLDETKPHRRDQSPVHDEDGAFTMSGALPQSHSQGDREQDGAGIRDDDSTAAAVQRSGGDHASMGKGDNDIPDDDDLDDIFAEHESSTAVAPLRRQQGPFEDDSEDEDDLDALLAEQREPLSRQAGNPSASTSNSDRQEPDPDEDDHADEEEIMRDMDMW